jgi:Flp pilus assembly protein TadD
MLIAAHLSSQVGQGASAKQWGERAEQFYKEQLLASPGDLNARMNLARSLMLLQRESEAAQLLLEGHNITGDQELKRAAGEALATWVHRIQKSEPATEENLVRRLQVLKQAVELAPTNALVLDVLVQAVIACAENTNPRVETLRKSILSSLDPESMHFIEGTVLLMRGDVFGAREHLEVASKHMENLPGVLNNMAVVLYQQENPDMERALSLSEAALERMPYQPYLRETRGQILVRMEQYERAIEDLEFALRAPELAGPVHESLATAYQELGRKELAEEHRAMATAMKEAPVQR